MPTQKKGLGKGLGAIFTEQEQHDHNGFIELDINMLETNKDQPRKNFDQETLEELAASIKIHGIIQPIIVTRLNDGYYKIIAGERRYRAARIAKLDTVPVIIREVEELDILQMALVENLQRKDLNALEEALCYKKLMDEFSLTQENVAERVGKGRATVANSIRLLALDRRVQTFLQEGRLSAGHCRALLGIKSPEEQFELAEMLIENEMSVREAEDLVSKRSSAETKPKPETKKPVAAASYAAAENRIMDRLGTKVTISKGKRKGKIEIEYYSDEDLDRIIYIIDGAR